MAKHYMDGVNATINGSITLDGFDKLREAMGRLRQDAEKAAKCWVALSASAASAARQEEERVRMHNIARCLCEDCSPSVPKPRPVRAICFGEIPQ